MSPPPKSKKSAGIGAKVANKHVYHPGKQIQGSPMPGQPGVQMNRSRAKQPPPVRVGKKDTGYPPMLRNRSSSSDI